MKNLILVIATLFLFSIADGKNRDKKKEKHNKNKTEKIDSTAVNIGATDMNFFENELRESVLEFIGDLGLDPDSCYVPFREAKK
jgi:hypothetical protein